MESYLATHPLFGKLPLEARLATAHMVANRYGENSPELRGDCGPSVRQQVLDARAAAAAAT